MKKIKSILNFIKAEYHLGKIPKRVLWGVAPTGDIHLGYLPYIKLLKYFKDKDSNIILLLANYHGYLDSEKTKWESIKERTDHYKKFFHKFGFSENDVVETKDVYTKPDYVEGFLKFSRFLPSISLTKFAQRTLKSFYTRDYKLSDFIYVGLQIFDVVYFRPDLVICGQDEAGIYKLGLPIIQKEVKMTVSYIYLPLVPGIYRSEMHASDEPNNKILIEEVDEAIIDRIKNRRKLINSLRRYLLPILDFSITEKYEKNSTKDLVKNLCMKVKNLRVDK
ncbi:MAG: hypothetical protein RML33_01240 [Acidobacteriota bacterium]|nr:hypothetical protein [Acidobacteriota bacterium]